MSKQAVVIGGTGAIGRYVVLDLLNNDNLSKVVVIGRRPYAPEGHSGEFQHPKLEQKIVDMEKLEETKDILEGKELAFCCLGTTRADAGSAENFRKVDYDLIVKFASMCKEANIPHLSVVSSQGANANSWFLYPKTKGEADDAMAAMSFPRLSIFRPGLLKRGDKARGVEKIADAVSFGMTSIEGSLVAKAMVLNALSTGKKGVEYLGNNEIRGLTKGNL